MMKKTHLAVGIAATLPFITRSNILLIPIALAGSVAADCDYKIGMKHRKITHTLLALSISSATLSIFKLNLGILWGLNYSTHLLLDSVTSKGIPLLYPVSKKNYGVKLFKTRRAEYELIALIALGMLAEL